MASQPQLEFTATDTLVRLKSYEDARLWLKSELDAWEWLWVGSNDARIQEVCAETAQGYNRLSNELNETENRSDLNVSALGSVFAANFTPLGILVYSGSRVGLAILGIRGTAGDEAARFAYAFHRRSVTMAAANAPTQLLGAMLLVMPEAWDAAEIADRMGKERQNFREATTSALKKMSEADEQRVREWDIERRNFRSLAARLLRRRSQAWTGAWTRQSADAVSAIDSIRGTENLYREAMKLKAPVEYWEAKAKKHREAEGRALTKLLIFFPLALLGLGGTFYTAGHVILTQGAGQHPAAPIALYVVVSGALATLSGVVFWIGRLLTKLYLSEHHLRHDADERAVMTTTYLALTADAAAGEEDRKIILSALFRSTPDGIVKDDGPADIGGLATLLARLVSK